MRTWIALFRGINVGGHNVLPMASLRHDLESLELQNVRTYIQSGNAIFDSSAKSAPSLTAKILRQIESQHGFRPHLLLLDVEALHAAIESIPFPEAVSEPKTLHFFFLSTAADSPNIEALERAAISTEKFALVDRVLYLHAPEGIGRSKFAATVEKHLGVVVTARNYRTVQKLVSMASQS